MSVGVSQAVSPRNEDRRLSHLVVNGAVISSELAVKAREFPPACLGVGRGCSLLRVALLHALSGILVPQPLKTLETCVTCQFASSERSLFSLVAPGAASPSGCGPHVLFMLTLLLCSAPCYHCTLVCVSP